MINVTTDNIKAFASVAGILTVGLQAAPMLFENTLGDGIKGFVYMACLSFAANSVAKHYKSQYYAAAAVPIAIGVSLAIWHMTDADILKKRSMQPQQPSLIRPV